MKLKKIAALILALVMVVPMTVACDINFDLSQLITTADSDGIEDPSNVIGNVTDPISGEGTYPSDIPITPPPELDYSMHESPIGDDMYFDFEGETFDILAWEQMVNEYGVDNLKGDSIDEQLVDRNETIEDLIGIKFAFNIVPGNSNRINNFVQTADLSIKNNSGAYDAIAAYSQAAGTLATLGLYENLYDFAERLCCDRVWWPEELIKDSTVADKLFFVSGDIATSFLYQMEFLIINDAYAAELGVNVPEIHDSVINGQWTIDKLFEVCDGAYADSDGKSGQTAGDRFGIYIKHHSLNDLFYVGAGLSYVDEKEDGLYLSEDYMGDVSTDILTRFVDKIKQDDSYYYTPIGSVDISEGNSLIYAATGLDVANARSAAEFSYSILPAPKYNEAQEKYYTAVNLAISMYSIPVDAPNKDMSGLTLALMEYYGYYGVSERIFADAFVTLNSPGSEDYRMLYIIRDGASFDLARTYYEKLGGDTNGPVRVWRNLFGAFHIKPGFYPNISNSDFWNQQLLEIYTALSSIE